MTTRRFTLGRTARCTLLVAFIAAGAPTSSAHAGATAAFAELGIPAVGANPDPGVLNPHGPGFYVVARASRLSLEWAGGTGWLSFTMTEESYYGLVGEGFVFPPPVYRADFAVDCIEVDQSTDSVYISSGELRVRLVPVGNALWQVAYLSSGSGPCGSGAQAYGEWMSGIVAAA